jgi:hypothetical protein
MLFLKSRIECRKAVWMMEVALTDTEEGVVPPPVMAEGAALN